MDEGKKGVLPPAVYVNYLRVASQPGEVFLSFGQVAQGQAAGAHLLSSLVTSPEQAKSMWKALGEALARHEARFGPIPEPEPPRAQGGAAEIPPGARPPRRDKPKPKSRDSKAG